MNEKRAPDCLDVRAEVDRYEFRADEGDHRPTEHERAMLEDFGIGLIERVVQPALGYYFHNPDSGWEFSESHPIESGECDDASEIEEVTPARLKELLFQAWDDAEELRAERDNSPQALGGEVHANRVAEVVELILQEQWDEWTQDTGCSPDDFKITRGPKLWFKAGAWARLVAERVADTVAPAIPALNTQDALVEALVEARLWVEKSTANVRGLSSEAAAPGEAALRKIDAALAKTEA